MTTKAKNSKTSVVWGLQKTWDSGIRGTMCHFQQEALDESSIRR